MAQPPQQPVANTPVANTPPTNPDYKVRVTITPVPGSGLEWPTCHEPIELIYDLVLHTNQDTLRLGYSDALVEHGWRLLQADPDIVVVEGRDWSFIRSGEEIVGKTPYPEVRFSYSVVPDDCATSRDGFGGRDVPDGPLYQYIDPEVRHRRIQEEARQGGERSYPLDPDINIPSRFPLPERPPPPPPPPPDGSR